MPRDLTGLPTPELLDLVVVTREEPEFRAAAAELLSRYSSIIYAEIARLLGRHSSLAEDAFQETFLRLFRWLIRHRGKAPIVSPARLLATFARRATIDMLRKHRPTEPLPDDLISPGTPADRQLEDALYVREILAALDDDRARQVLRLSFLEGLLDREVAARLGVKENYVRQLRFRALNTLREHQALDDLANLIDPV